MTKWIQTHLGNIAVVIMGQSPKSEYYNSTGDGLPFLQGNRTFGHKYPTFDTYTTHLTKIAKPQDIIMSVRAPVGDLNITPVEICIGRGVCALRMKNGNQSFLYYLMKYYAPNLRNKESGTVFGSINRNDIENLDINIPDYDVQKKIAGVLGALDDKIELNNKINQNLEAQAQALFKSWFIDFEPFGGKMPNDWKIGKLKDIIKLKRNTIKAGQNKELPYLPIDIIPMNSLAISEIKDNREAQSSLITFEKNDILIGAMRVYFHRVIIAPCAGITRTTCFVLSPFEEKYLSYSILLCNQNSSIEFAQKTSKGSTMPYAIWEGGFGELQTPIPPLKIAEKFNDMVEPLIKQIQNSYFENRKLAELRDTLLPKLMNGEIDVDNVKID